MNSRIIRSLIISSALLVASVNHLSAAEPPKEDKAFFDKLVTAIMKADYESFVEDGVGSLKQMTKEQFDAAVTQLGPRLNSGYQVTYLGAIKRRTGQLTLWRIVFTGVDDEALATLNVKDGKVTTFTIR